MSATPGRLAWLDAPRGLTVAGMLPVNDPGDWDHVYRPLEHAAGNGSTPTDLLFRLFLFVMALLLSLPTCAVGRRFGMNAIAACAGSELMQILLPALGWQQPLYRHLFAAPLAGPCVASLAWPVAFVALWWPIVRATDRRRLYLRP
jgi:predicted acyltransferase